MRTLWNHAVLKALILTGNHWGIAVLLFVAVFVGAETLHEAQVALSQELARKSKDENIKKWSIKAEEAPLMMNEMQHEHIDSPDAKRIGAEAKRSSRDWCQTCSPVSVTPDPWMELSPWTASPAACGLLSWEWGCCWRNRATGRRAPPSPSSKCLPSERRGWKHTAPTHAKGRGPGNIIAANN